MAKKRNYSVGIRHDAVEMLGTAKHLLHKAEPEPYFLAKSVDPSGPFVLLEILWPRADGEPQELELYIPHHAIAYMMRAGDLTQFGFTE